MGKTVQAGSSKELPPPCTHRASALGWRAPPRHSRPAPGGRGTLGLPFSLWHPLPPPPAPVLWLQHKRHRKSRCLNRRLVSKNAWRLPSGLCQGSLLLISGGRPSEAPHWKDQTDTLPSQSNSAGPAQTAAETALVTPKRDKVKDQLCSVGAGNAQVSKSHSDLQRSKGQAKHVGDAEHRRKMGGGRNLEGDDARRGI